MSTAQLISADLSASLSFYLAQGACMQWGCDAHLPTTCVCTNGSQS